MMTSSNINNEQRHWLERCQLQDEHWNMSPWPPQIARPAESDSEEDEGDVESFPHSYPLRGFPSSQHENGTQSLAKASSASSAKKSKPTYNRSLTSRHYHTTDDLDLEDRPSQMQQPASPSTSSSSWIGRRRTKTAPEPAQPLHIDTILPLQLPPSSLRTLSPLRVYPCPWWPSESSEEDNLHRSESEASFVSAISDGSWHGDNGDFDPNEQLEKAIENISNKKMVSEGVVLSTYDYNEEDEQHGPHSDAKVAAYIKTLQDQFRDTVEDDEQKKDDGDSDDAMEIRSSAGFMNRFASMFLLDATSLFRSSSSSSSSGAMTPKQQRPLQRAHSDAVFFGPVSSPDQLLDESNSLSRGRRQRAATTPTSLHSELVQSRSSKLSSVMQWLIPPVDEQLEQEWFGHTRPHTRSRTDSTPALSSASTSDSIDGEDHDEEEGANDTASVDSIHTTDEDTAFTEEGPLYDVTLSSKRNFIPKSAAPTPTKRRNVNIDGDVSPLWDNRWAEEPYHRSWSSVLGLSSSTLL